MMKTTLRREQMNRAFRWAALLFAGFLIVTQQVMGEGPLIDFDAWVARGKRPKLGPWLEFAVKKIDNLGLRGLTATFLIIAAVIVARRYRSWRPLNLAFLSLLVLNGVVGISKLAIGRTKPRMNIDLVKAGGLSYPSGHASNALLTWGMLAYIAYRYTHRAARHGTALAVSVATITLSVCIVSLFRNTHWFSDLLGGLFIGGALLVLIIAIDRFVPSDSQHS